jgi:hypothetical protein
VRLPATFGLREASWSAVAERSGDTAFHVPAMSKSGVALLFPPQSKTGGWCSSNKGEKPPPVQTQRTIHLFPAEGGLLTAVPLAIQNHVGPAGLTPVP